MDAADRQSARQVDPTGYLEALGYTVRREGQHLSVRAHGDEVYRLTRKPEGHWLWCDRLGNDGGDNISLVAELEPGLGYAESVFRLLGGPTVRQALPAPAEPKRVPPVVPAAADASAGRDYLEGRGISAEVIRWAEDTGFLRFIRGAVLFLGRDEGGTIQNATRRATDPADPIQKRDLRGSDKRYPPILPGNGPDVWLVEGGADALAVHDLTARAGRPRPTVVVSGGVNVRALFKMRHIRELLRRAARVILARDHERDPATQQRADLASAKQASDIEEITGKQPMVWRPQPGQGKDLAEVNAWQEQAQEAAPRRYSEGRPR